LTIKNNSVLRLERAYKCLVMSFYCYQELHACMRYRKHFCRCKFYIHTAGCGIQDVHMYPSVCVAAAVLANLSCSAQGVLQ